MEKRTEEDKKQDALAKKQEDLLAEMQETLTVMKNRLDTAEDENEVYRQTVEDLKESVAGGNAAGMSIEPKAEVFKDPFDKSKNPFRIDGIIPPDAEFPKGQCLYWANPTIRNLKGWKGLIPLEYGDQYTGDDGEKLREYGINDAPPRMSGPDRVDNQVRRATSVLSRIDKRIYDVRQQRREDRANQAASAAGSSATINVQDGVQVVGAGLTDSARPSQGYKMGEQPILGEHSRTLPVRKKDG